MKTIFTFLMIVGYSILASGQWIDYLSYSSAKKVVEAENKIYCATTGGLLTYNKADNSIEKLTGINGLSDVGIQTIGYGEESGMVLIAYENSNIDLINNNNIFNLSDIKRKQIIGDKKIYNIFFVGQTAYLSCGFGIVVLNLEKREVKDTYYIGDNGSSVLVLDMTSDGQFLYAATEKGLFKANINSPNLQDFNNWEHIDNIPNATGTFDQLEFFHGNVIANYSGNDSNSDKLYRLEGDSWSAYLPMVTHVDDMQVKGSTLILARKGQVDLYDQNGNRLEKITNYSFADYTISGIHATSATLGSEGTLWIADFGTGLVKKSGQSYERLLPAGPADNHVFALTSNGKDLWVSSGGRNAVWNNRFFNPQFQLFRDGEWKVFNANSHAELSGFHDIVCVTVNPNDPDHVFAGSWGGGIVEFRNNQFVERYNHFNSTLQTALPDDESPNFVRIGGMAFDSQGNLWATNALVDRPLSVLKTDGTWESFDFVGVSTDDNLGQIVITKNDDQWAVLGGGNDLYVRRGDGSESKKLLSIAAFNSSEGPIPTPLNDIYSIAIDREGAIWIGTSQGVAVYDRPENVWTTTPFYSRQPSLDLKDGLFHPLLESETVTAIAIDGANRKWLGTQNSGIFLVSENGERELEHFTESNSPLLSNEITSVAINPDNGEVFIGTSNGLISYRGAATEGNDDYSDVYAYPNPVREDYDGDIMISGLIEDTDIKITDISGNLVYKTKSLGGQAVWNGKNLRGKRVSTGVYMVLGNDKQGEQAFVTKILFIH